MEIGKDTLKKLTLILFGAIAFGWCINNYKIFFGIIGTIWGYVFPFALGGCFAFLINIPMRQIEKQTTRLCKKLKHNKSKEPSKSLIRGFSIAITLLIFFGIVSALTAVIIPQISCRAMRRVLYASGDQAAARASFSALGRALRAASRCWAAALSGRRWV